MKPYKCVKGLSRINCLRPGFNVRADVWQFSICEDFSYAVSLLNSAKIIEVEVGAIQ